MALILGHDPMSGVGGGGQPAAGGMPGMPAGMPGMAGAGGQQ